MVSDAGDFSLYRCTARAYDGRHDPCSSGLLERGRSGFERKEDSHESMDRRSDSRTGGTSRCGCTECGGPRRGTSIRSRCDRSALRYSSVSAWGVHAGSGASRVRVPAGESTAVLEGISECREGLRAGNAQVRARAPEGPSAWHPAYACSGRHPVSGTRPPGVPSGSVPPASLGA